jgi:hypothetical protein
MGTIITLIIWAICLIGLIFYLKLGKSCGHVPDFRKPTACIGFGIATIIMVIILACSSCSGTTKYIPVETTHYVKTTETLRDTIIQVQLSPSKETIIMLPKDTISHLFNQYADSWVKVKDGYISHSLNILPIDIPVKATIKDTSIKDSIRIPVPYPVVKHEIIYKDKELNWYQRACVWGFSIILGLLAIWILSLILKIRSNGIQTVFKWLFKKK